MTTPTNHRGPRPRPDARRGTRAERRERPRRALAAGNVIVVMVVAAILGSLLNAAGIRKTAAGQPVGFRRDVARFFAEPLYDVSHALGIDRLRQGIQAITGRSGDDDIDLSLPGPTTTDDTEEPAAAAPVEVAKRKFSPTERMKVWIGGDSLSITPGESFVSLAPSTEVIDVVGNNVDGHVATGLARPEVFNWPGHMADVIAQDQPDVVVITLGSNDDQTLTGEGGVGPYGSPEWIAEYGRRVGGMMDAITANGDRVLFWLGTPVIRTRAEDRYNVINDIYRQEAEKRPGRVVYIDLDQRYRGPDGGYVDYKDDVQVRTPDGVHFTRAGGDQVAQLVIDQIGKVFDLTSWRAEVTTTTAGPTGTSTTPTTTARSAKKKTTTTKP